MAFGLILRKLTGYGDPADMQTDQPQTYTNQESTGEESNSFLTRHENVRGVTFQAKG